MHLHYCVPGLADITICLMFQAHIQQRSEVEALQRTALLDLREQAIAECSHRRQGVDHVGVCADP